MIKYQGSWCISWKEIEESPEESAILLLPLSQDFSCFFFFQVLLLLGTVLKQQIAFELRYTSKYLCWRKLELTNIPLKIAGLCFTCISIPLLLLNVKQLDGPSDTIIHFIYLYIFFLISIVGLQNKSPLFCREVKNKYAKTFLEMTYSVKDERHRWRTLERSGTGDWSGITNVYLITSISSHWECEHFLITVTLISFVSTCANIYIRCAHHVFRLF